MTSISNAIGLERVSRIVGYDVQKGDFREAGANLPMRVVVLGEANSANQSGLSTLPKVVTSAEEAGNLYGFGSTIHQMMRILRPVNGGGIGGIETVVIPQASDVAAVAAVMTLFVSGTADKNATHKLRVNGRYGVDGQVYSFSVASGDSASDIRAKIVAAINAVAGSPVIASEESVSAIAGYGALPQTKAQLAALRAVANGSLTVTVDGADEDLTLMDFTGMPDPEAGIGAALTAAAAVIDAKLTGADATASALGVDKGEIVITSKTTGASSTIAFSADATGTDISVATMLDISNAEIHAGQDAGNAVKLTAKWKGLTSDELRVSVFTNDVAAGMTYAVEKLTAGSGAVSIAAALAAFGENWNTFAINPYGSTKFAEIESFVGVPGVTNPTGRYTGNVFKPCIFKFGSILSDKDDIVALTDASARKDQVANSLAPAPNSEGFPWEAAANLLLLEARTFEDSPHLDAAGQFYPDMPVPVDENIGDMADYENRDYLSQRGASTVMLKNGKYQVQDDVTTYHPDGELPPQFRYVRSLLQDWNVRYSWLLIEDVNVRDKAITGDMTPVTASNVISPKQVKGMLIGLANDLATRAIITDPDFMIDSIQVQTGDTNPDRLEARFRYKRSSFHRIGSTTAVAGFAFGLAA